MMAELRGRHGQCVGEHVNHMVIGGSVVVHDDAFLVHMHRILKLEVDVTASVVDHAAVNLGDTRLVVLTYAHWIAGWGPRLGEEYRVR